VITNHPEGSFTTSDIQNENAVRWQIEQLHWELKQLTRSQPNPLACCYLAWLSLKVKATQCGKTLFAAQHNLLSDYLRAELRNPHIPAFLIA